MKVALSGQDPEVVAARYHALKTGHKKKTGVEGFMDRLAEQRKANA